MDVSNRFHTRVTHTLERLDYLLAAGLLSAVLYDRRDDVNWWAFGVLFWVIDVIGTFPALTVYHRAKRHTDARPVLIHPAFNTVYNVTHSLVVGGVVALALSLATGGPELYMLAIPLHLWLDRSVFGNAFKPAGVSFEPEKDPRFAQFEDRFASLAEGTHR